MIPTPRISQSIATVCHLGAFSRIVGFHDDTAACRPSRINRCSPNGGLTGQCRQCCVHLSVYSMVDTTWVGSDVHRMVGGCPRLQSWCLRSLVVASRAVILGCRQRVAHRAAMMRALLAVPGCDRCVPADQPSADDARPGAAPDDVERGSPEQTFCAGTVASLWKGMNHAWPALPTSLLGEGCKPGMFVFVAHKFY